MLSVSNVSVAQASTYYQQDNYYAQTYGEWYGNLAQEFGLNDLKFNDFQNFINGKNQNGEQLVSTNKRAGIDLTFSAPKSLSLILETAEVKDKDLAQAIKKAHDMAVNKALDSVQKNNIYYREQVNKNRVLKQSNGMLVAKFQHDDSRELDPQLHTHCVVMNIVKDDKGNFKALSNEEIFNNKLLLGQTYRNELAKNLNELGYNISITDIKKGFFEIEGVNQELISNFSKRREQVINAIDTSKTQNINKALDIATTSSRKSKDKNVDREQIRIDNVATIDSIQSSYELLSLNKLQKQNIQQFDYIQKAIDTLIENESAFSKKDILMMASKLAIGIKSVEEIEQEFVIKSKELIQLKDNLYTTQELLNIEKSNVEFAVNTKNMINAITNKSVVDNFVQNHSKFKNMTDGQLNALTHISTSNDRVIVIQGDAGTGKTFSMEALKELVAQQNPSIELVGLSFTGKASEGLENDSGIKSHTLHSFLNKKDTRLYKPLSKQFAISKKSKKTSNMIQEPISVEMLPNIEDTRVNSSNQNNNTKDNNNERKFIDNRPDTRLYKPLSKRLARGREAKISNYMRTLSTSDMAQEPKEAEMLLQSNELSNLDDRNSEQSINYVRWSDISDNGTTTKSIEKIYIVDEASMLSSTQMHQLFEKAQKDNARIVLIGDTKQFQSIAQGRMFDELQKVLPVASMEEVLRQKTKHLISAVKSIKDKDIDIAFTTLQDNIQEIDTNDKLLTSAKEQYLSYLANNNQSTLLITSKNSWRKELNNSIRQELLATNQINDNQKLSILDSTNLRDLEKTQGSSFRVGQVVQISQAIPNFKAGEQHTIKSINNNVLTLSNNKEINLSLNGNKINAFTKLHKEFATGETIIFTKNDKNIGVKNGEVSKIKSIKEVDNDYVITCQSGDKQVSFKISEYPYIDYGYAITDYKSQGQTADNVVVMADATLANYNSFYVQLTRAKHNVSIFTNDLEQLKTNVSYEQIKLSTINGELNVLNHEKIDNFAQKLQNLSEANKFDEAKELINNAIKRAMQAEQEWKDNLKSISLAMHKVETNNIQATEYFTQKANQIDTKLGFTQIQEQEHIDMLLKMTGYYKENKEMTAS